MLHKARANHLLPSNRIALIGLPTDAGASCRGAALGAEALRAAGLAGQLAQAGYRVEDLGDLPVERGVPPAAEIDTLAVLASHAGYRCLEHGDLPVFLGGDHSISMGSVAGVARYCREAGRPLFVLWLDAHGDFNTKATTETGNIHGMALARLCGEPGFDNAASWFAPVDPDNVLIFGARSLDCEEAELIEQRGIEVLDADTIRLAGVEHLLGPFLERVEAANGHLHVSFDIDVMDPSLAPGVGTTVPGGLSLDDGMMVMNLLHRSGRLRSLDLVELNPVLDRNGMSADLMVDLTTRLFGGNPEVTATTQQHVLERA